MKNEENILEDLNEDFIKRKKRALGEIWKEKEGSKTYWKIQLPLGIHTTQTKREAIKHSVAFGWRY